MEPVALVAVERIEITTLVDNFVDALLLDQGPVLRLPMRLGAEPVPAASLSGGTTWGFPTAEHGVSFLVDFTTGSRAHRVLFDTGTTPDGMVENMRRLQIDPASIEAIVLSHGHFDHTTGMDGLIRTLGHAALPVWIHPAFWTQRRVAIPGRDPLELPSTSRAALDGAGFAITEERLPSFIMDGALLVTGEVDRTTDFETGFPIHEALHRGSWEPDPLILDDQALIANVAGKGLVILTGCGHAGIVNTVRYARKLTGIQEVHAIIGGMHLNGPFFEPIIEPTVRALAQVGPAFMLPAHCTGWKAMRAVSEAMPEAFVQNSVGTRLVLEA